MVIGKTSSSISKTEIFNKYSEIQVLSAVFPEINTVPCKISSPFRSDSNPSFSIYMDDNHHIRFKDFGDTSSHGSLLDLLCRYWKCSFNQVFDKILELMSNHSTEDISPSEIKPKQIKMLTRKESSELTKIQVAVRPWRDYDYEYWSSYGIEPQWLHYAEVYPISHKIVTKKDLETGKTKKYIFPTDKLAYVFVERKDGELQLKCYQPLNKKGFKWCSSMDSSVISLWTKVPEYGDRIVICSSLKDALCISNTFHIPAIAPQGEGYSISNTAIGELKRRYKEIYISFDGDSAGTKDAQKLSKSTGFEIISCPILDTPNINNNYVKKLIKEGLQKKDKAKDWSDIFLYFGKDRLVEEFNKAFSNRNGRSLETD